MPQQSILILKSDPISPEVEEIAFSNATSFHDRLGDIMVLSIENEADLELYRTQLLELTTDMQAFCNSFLEGHTRAQPGFSAPGLPIHLAEGYQAATA